MAEVSIRADERTEFGKGFARRTRVSGRVPGVLYGHGTEPRHVSLPARELGRALKTDAGFNVLLRLDMDGGSELALPKAVQRDPLRGSLDHIDLILVRRGEKVTVDVAIHLVGEADREALIDQQSMTLSVEAEATHIPQAFEVSLEGLRVGDHVTASQVSLPEGTTLAGDPELVIVQLLAAPTEEQVEAELADAEADLGAGAAGAAALAEAAAEEAGEAGEGDVVPDTDSDAGGPGGAPSDDGDGS